MPKNNAGTEERGDRESRAQVFNSTCCDAARLRRSVGVEPPRPSGRCRLSAKYEASIKDPDAFWAEEAKRIHWFTPPTRIKNTNFGPGDVAIRWFEDGATNVADNCIDRHLHTRGDQVAITGKATIRPSRRRSPIASFTTRSAAWPTSCATAASRRATGSRSTCR